MKIQTHYEDLDESLKGGFECPSFVIIGARCGVGKTAFMLNLAANIQEFNKLNTCIISLDLTSEQIANRYEEMQEKSGRNIGNIEILDIPVRFEEIIEFITEKSKIGIKVFFIDYLQLFNLARENLYEESSYIAVTLKNLCNKLNICIILASQLSRATEARVGHRPILTDLRDSGALEESADLVLLLLRREYYDPNDKPGQCEIIIAKNRSGFCTSTILTYVKKTGEFFNYVPLSYAYTEEKKDDEF